MFCWYVWLDNWKCAPSTPLIHFLASCKKESPQSLLSLVWFWWIMFAGFRCGLNLNTEMCRAWSPPPQKKPPNSHSFQSSPAPKLCVFEQNTPLSYTGPPRWPSSLPCLSLSLSLCFYLGAVRAPLLKLLLKREHIQRGLSQSLSVSIKDPGNTTLSREPLLKGQWDPGSFFFSFFFFLPSHHFHGKRGENRNSTQQINYSWTVCELCRASSLQAPSTTTTATSATSVQTDAVTSDITVCSNTTWTHTAALRPTSDGNQAQQLLFTLQLTLRSVLTETLTFKQIPRHSDDIILVMWSDKYIFFFFFLVTFLFSPASISRLHPAVIVNKILICHVKLRLKHFKLLTS